MWRKETLIAKKNQSLAPRSAAAIEYRDDALSSHSRECIGDQSFADVLFIAGGPRVRGLRHLVDGRRGYPEVALHFPFGRRPPM
jgi:hypothetical protein